MGEDYQSPITEGMDEFGKVGVKSLSYNQSQLQIMIQQKAMLTRTSKVDNYVRSWLHRCMCGSEKETLILLENPELQGNLMQCFDRREKQVHNGLKLITQDERA